MSLNTVRSETVTPIAIVSSACTRRYPEVPREVTCTSRMSPVSHWRRSSEGVIGLRLAR